MGLLHRTVLLYQHVDWLSGGPDVVLADPPVICAYRWLLLCIPLLLIRRPMRRVGHFKVFIRLFVGLAALTAILLLLGYSDVRF